MYKSTARNFPYIIELQPGTEMELIGIFCPESTKTPHNNEAGDCKNSV